MTFLSQVHKAMPSLTHNGGWLSLNEIKQVALPGFWNQEEEFLNFILENGQGLQLTPLSKFSKCL